MLIIKVLQMRFSDHFFPHSEPKNRKIDARQLFIVVFDVFSVETYFFFAERPENAERKNIKCVLMIKKRVEIYF